jgi:hypothetical protein
MHTISRWILSILLVTAISCQQNSKEHDKDHAHDADAADVVETSGNQELYNEVMKIHDEVMPKMNDIHKLKQELKEKLTKAPKLTEAEKMEIDAMIAKLDSAGESMMDWMHKFQPIPDSLGEEKAREYLEGEIEKVKKVRENITEALEKAKQK